MDNFLQELTKAAEQIADKLTEAAPHAWELILQATRVEGLSQVATGIALVIAGVLLACMANWLREWRRKEGDWKIKKSYRETEILSPWIVPVTVLGLGGVVLTGIGLIGKLFNVWYWAAIFYPKVYIAHKALESVGAQ